eukprot:m.16841 g.16841  ORF g.16841 m.16841 type:complete len:620 (+) comp10617_c0_seq2:51-1910(+)
MYNSEAMANSQRAKRKKQPASLDWFASSFTPSNDDDNDDIIEIKEVKPPSRFNPGQLLRRSSSTQQQSIASLSDISRRRQSKLAVHAKKAMQLRQWLRDVYASIDRRPAGSRMAMAPVVLLSGPAGCGKTATVQELCKELDLELVEWINTSSASPDTFVDEYRPVYESQSKQFQRFLLRAPRYPSLTALPANRRKKLILVEDLPTYLLQQRAVDDFHSLLRTLPSRTNSPIVFIVSDEHLGSQSRAQNRLFPRSQEGLLFYPIRFNPVSATAMKAVLKDACKQLSTSVPDTTLKDIVDSSAGDIRSALQTLSIATTQPKLAPSVRARPPAKRSKRKTAAATKVNIERIVGPSGRGASLQMFHALGKILNAKRTDEAPSIESTLPQSLAQHARNKFKSADAPEDVLEASCLGPSMFSQFLHHNYLPFIGQLDDMVNIADAFSEAESLDPDDGLPYSTRNDYYGNMLCRSLVFHNQHPVKGFRALRKPPHRHIQETVHDLKYSSRLLFQEASDCSAIMSLPVRQLMTEFLPWVSVIPGVVRPGTESGNHLYRLTEFDQFHGDRGTSLTEKDAVDDEDQIAMQPCRSSSKPHASVAVENKSHQAHQTVAETIDDSSDEEKPL